MPANGIIIAPVTIANVTNISGQPLPYGDKKTVDIGVELTLEVGKDFQPKLIIAGNFKRNEVNQVTGWGSGFKVMELMKILCPEYIGPTKDTGTVPPDAVVAMRGKQILRLSYVTGRRDDGRLKYADWSIVAPVGDDNVAVLEKKWERSIKNGYPKNFAPEAVAGENNSFPVVQ